MIAFAAPAVPASDQDSMAVCDFKAEGVSRQTASIISEWVRTGLANTKLKVVDRTQLNEIVKEKELQEIGLTDSGKAVKAVKAGKLLSAKKMLVGSVSKLGGKYIISGRLISVAKGTSELGHSECTWRESELDVCAQRFVDNVYQKVTGAKITGQVALIPVVESRPGNADEQDKDRIRKTIHTLYDAYINKDLEAYLSVVEVNARFWCSSYNLQGKEQIRRYRRDKTFVQFDNFTYDLKEMEIRITGDSAILYDTYVLNYTVRATGKKTTESARERFLLKKRGNSWYILENQEY